MRDITGVMSQLKERGVQEVVLTGIELASCGIVGTEEQGRSDERVGAAVSQTSGASGDQARGAAGGRGREEGLTVITESSYG
jgi:hypothetical protein